VKRASAIVLAALLVSSLYLYLFPVPVAADPGPEDKVAEILEKWGFDCVLRKSLLDQRISPLEKHLLTGWQVLNFYGGEEAVRRMLASWGLSESQIDDVIAYFATNAKIERRMDIVAKVPGKWHYFLIETKGASDMNTNVVHAVKEALYDAYLAAQGEPVVWLTEGEPSRYAVKKAIALVTQHGGVHGISIHDETAIANTLNLASKKVYNIPIGDIVTALKDKVRSILDWFEDHQSVVVSIALIGANIALDLWEPKDQLGVQAKELLKNALDALGIGVCALTAPEGAAALALFLAVSTDVATAALAMDYLPLSFGSVHEAIIGRASNSNVKAVEREIGGVKIRLVYMRPPSVFFPARLVAVLNDQPFMSLSVDRWTLTIDEPFGIPITSTVVADKTVLVAYNKTAVSAMVWGGSARTYTYENATHVCTVAEWTQLSWSWSVRVWQVAGEVNPPVVARSSTSTQVACLPKPSGGCDVSCVINSTSSGSQSAQPATQYATVKVSVAAGCGHAVAVPQVWFYPSGPEVTVPVGSLVVLKAVPCEGCSFRYWLINNGTKTWTATGSYLELTVNGSLTVKAYFTDPPDVPKLVLRAETVNKEPVYVNMTGWVFWVSSNGVPYNTSFSNAAFRSLEFTLKQQYPMGFKVTVNRTAVWVGVRAVWYGSYDMKLDSRNTASGCTYVTWDSGSYSTVSGLHLLLVQAKGERVYVYTKSGTVYIDDYYGTCSVFSGLGRASRVAGWCVYTGTYNFNNQKPEVSETVCRWISGTYSVAKRAQLKFLRWELRGPDGQVLFVWEEPTAFLPAKYNQAKGTWEGAFYPTRLGSYELVAVFGAP